MDFREYYTQTIYDLIKEEKAKIEKNHIFVILAQTELLNIKPIQNAIADIKTFLLNGNEQIFDRNWFTNIFTTLNNTKDYHIISYPQFSYLINYIDASFFKDRVIILKDNLRQLFPINKTEFSEETKDENIEERTDIIPIYQAEQLQINDFHFYSIRQPSEEFTCIDIFKTEFSISETYLNTDNNFEIIDISSDQYALDVFINQCIRQNNFNKKGIVKIYSKQNISQTILNNVLKINYLLHLFGGELYKQEEEVITNNYKKNRNTELLLKRYWGYNAEFRSLKIYQTPNINNQVIEISQGLIVDKIISEYENSKKGKKPRDLFLTAPTGAGKSLLFQLPSFYISNKGDVTIIVSPLIALMKDQVNAIIKDRGFDKVAYLNSELSLIDRDKIIDSCKNGEIDILYMSPELLLSYDITYFIGQRQLGLLVIDEAHLITTWGRDFRVDYWFLGNHIRKIRKYHNLNFPMVALTATAIYGGANDMVFDSIDSLVMQNPHIFIGSVKRDDITFIINNYDNFETNYELKKIEQTVDFINKIKETKLKTLIYTPYSIHIQKIQQKLQNNIAVGYYGTMASDQKQFSFELFKSGQKKIMISTKAFGMGVDISDIELVYHHSPSGLLPDYVQEIGRVARKKNIKGFAALNYSSKDQRYTKALHGMSALRQYQIWGVLKKIYKTYLKNNKSRNLLLSVEDFGHIFENTSNLDQKVLTALMMIEKDYLAKHRFNILIARPKKLFVKVYAKIPNDDLKIFNNKYPKISKKITQLGNYSIVEMNLDKLWYQNFNNQSFPILKKNFYDETLFNKDNIKVIPQLKISFEKYHSYDKIYQSIQGLFECVQNIFSKQGSTFFNQKYFEEQLNDYLDDKTKSEKISKFILSSYSGRLIQQGVIEDNAFLQQRRENGVIKYRVFTNQYRANFSSIIKKLHNLFENTDTDTVNRYITNREINSINYVRLGYFLEILDLGTFEIKGGENPLIFIRINDPFRIEKDSNNSNYKNVLLSKTLERHKLSNQIFDHFFLNSFTNEERWNFIEDFFLGIDVDLLLEKYQGNQISNNIDIIEHLRTNSFPIDEKITDICIETNIHRFPPKENHFYQEEELLTLKIEDKDFKTMKIKEWVSKEPLVFHKEMTKFKMRIDNKLFQILVNRLKLYHFEYFRDFLGLKLKITFKGYNEDIQAIVPYKDKPVEFYKWWCLNPENITMTFKEKIELFYKVEKLAPKILKKEHKEKIK